jgi:hypothetical protein
MSGLIHNATGHLRFKRVLSAMSNQSVFEYDADKVIQAKKRASNIILFISVRSSQSRKIINGRGVHRQ